MRRTGRKIRRDDILAGCSIAYIKTVLQAIDDIAGKNQIRMILQQLMKAINIDGGVRLLVRTVDSHWHWRRACGLAAGMRLTSG